MSEESDSWKKHFGKFLSWLTRLFADVSYHLPLLLFLSGGALYFEETGAFVALDSAMVMLASSQTREQSLTINSGAQYSDDVIAVLVSQHMFNEQFGRVLPVNRDKLAELVATVAKAGPKVIAIDVDVSRLSTTGCEDTPRDSGRLHRTIIETVQSGISVTAVKYPSPYAKSNEPCLDTLESKANEAVTRLADENTTDAPRFLFASPDLDIDEQPGVVVRFENPLYDSNLHAREGHHPKRMPLVPSLGIAAALLGNITKENMANGILCSIKPSKNCEALRFDHGEIAQHEHYLINFFHPPRQIVIEQLEDLNDPLVIESIKSRIVFIGIESFGNTDRYLTPIGYQSGALIHAAIGGSMKKPIEESHGLAVCLDVFAGLAFLYLFKWTSDGAKSLSRHPTLNQALILIGPCVALAFSFLLTFWFIVHLISKSLWINPLPIFLGLSVHLYLESIEKAHGHAGEQHPAHGRHPKWLASWIREKLLGLSGVFFRLSGLLRKNGRKISALAIVDDTAWVAFHVLVLCMIYRSAREIIVLFGS